MTNQLMSKTLSLPIRTQMLLMALIVALPAAGIIIHSGLKQRQTAIRSAVEETRKIGNSLASEQQHAAESAELLMAALAQLPDIKNHNAGRTRMILADILKLNPMYLNISVADPDGMVWASAMTIDKVPITDRRYFRNAMATGRLASGEYVMSRIAKQPTFNLCYPFKNQDGSIAGLLLIGFRLDQMGHDLFMVHSRRFNYLMLDHRGVVLRTGTDPAQKVGEKDLEEFFQRMQGEADEGSFVGTGYDGKEHFITYRKLTLPGEQTPYLYIRTGIPVATVVQKANDLLLHNLLIFASSLLCAFLVAWSIGKRSIVDRIATLRRAARHLAQGDLQVRISDQVQGGELGELSQAFDEMAQQLDLRERERNRAELALRLSESRYRSLFENSLFGIALVSPQGRFLQVNEAFCSYLGYPESELVGVRSFADVTHPDDITLSVDRHQGMVRREVERYTLEKRYLTKSGQVLQAFCFVEGIYDEDGRCEANIACILDITQLRASEERMRLYFERQMVGMAIVSPERRWLKANARLQRMFGYTAEELAGMSWTDLTHPDDLPRDLATFNRVLAGEIDDYVLEKRCLCKDGSVLHAYLSVGCVRRYDGAVDYLLALMNDMTERKRAEEEIRLLHTNLEQRVRERTAQLEAAIREQESFSYSVSHDLRSPLRHINSYLCILQEEFGDSFPREARYYLERACAGSVKMGKLIDDLLKLSRVSRSTLVKERVDLSALAQGIATMLRETDQGRAAQIEIAPDLWAMGDKVLMGLVLENLLGNAWKYSSRKECARVAFGAREVGGEHTFYVMDNGAGFDMAYSDKLFGPFQRLHGEEYDGTGIGLATVQRIIERHGGAVWAEGQIGLGATFYFRLP